MLKKLLIPILLILVVFYTCTDRPEEKINAFSQRTLQLKKQLIEDKTLDVFEFDIVEKDGWILEGTTTSIKAANRMRLLADSILGEGNYTDSIMQLPDPALGDSAVAVVIVSVTPLRRKARHSSEIVDQVIMGNPLQLLKKHRGWYLVKNHYGYIGWITKTAMQRMDEKSLDIWESSELLQVNQLLSFIYEEPNLKSYHLADLVLNASVKKIGQKGKWVNVELADGEKGWVQAAHLKPYIENKKLDEVNVADVIRTAKRMLGVPYLWGGKSSKANDCSGFTQTAFRANGIQLPRDASQQARIGKEIVPDSTFSNVRAGDLLFFGTGKRITHVGLSLGGYRFIHQDSDVHIDSFNSDSEQFNAFRKKSLKIIKRIF